jgi:ribosomal protein S18 acetylase RimI-like enzyme
MVHIVRMKEPEPKMVEFLFSRAGMKLEAVNGNFFADDKNILLVAHAEKEPAGFLFAYLLDYPTSPKPLMFLYSIDVFSPHQNRGLGTALITALKDLAVGKGCSEIFVLTNESNAAANRLYQKTGGVRENKDDVMYVYKL